jgi:hypothetical protein
MTRGEHPRRATGAVNERLSFLRSHRGNETQHDGLFTTSAPKFSTRYGADKRMTLLSQNNALSLWLSQGQALTAEIKAFARRCMNIMTIVDRTKLASVINQACDMLGTST